MRCERNQLVQISKNPLQFRMSAAIRMSEILDLTLATNSSKFYLHHFLVLHLMAK